ncbi:SDR family NAD(P)-dependent oxidoreductase [[Mycobacterium] burgundiense]|uniref:SDR family NAD(P)-dependent oxidoreductase n=1 Tax=[Mycobacterium] burgundiense TaxID=3064286 RepID=A0ABM9M4Q1_9MYCO|nr:SDR family NAD(P)-dependent oxidoreductase [Mycolicibacterium sp. MU0053]CAJ1510148.1 SDR family NAD(P)-dependent oxidoreductase [Mycolicibacterium sp. MU0053]
MPAVLVTGAARGIGRAITAHLATLGWDVVAGVRSAADAAAIGSMPRVTPVTLDVTDSAHIAALDDGLPERLDAVVNNAGVVVGGPLETIGMADLRRQLEVNVVGQLAVTQAVLPRLRRSRGRIVFISSVNGRISVPLLGAYCASKFALEAAADALRMELRPWHIDVSVVEPAQTATDMWETAPQTADDLEAAMSAEQRVLYAKHVAGFRKMIPLSQRLAAQPHTVAEVVEEALTAKRPSARYATGLAQSVQMAVMTNVPPFVSDVLVRRLFGQP